MKLWIKSLLLAVGLLFGGALLASAAGCNPFVVATGGTGDCAFVANTILLGNGTGKIATTTAGTNGNILALANGIPTWTATSTNFVTSILPGTGISVSGNTGAVTVTNTGVTSLTFGTGLSGGNITTTGTAALLSYLATSSAETAGRIPYWTSTSGTPAAFSGGDAGLLWSTSLARLTATNASSTASTIASSLYIPNAANPTLNTAGQIALDTTVASSSLHFFDAQGEHAVFASTSVSFVYATSTPVGTTTLQIAGAARKLIYSSIGCSSVGGTANVQLGNSTASTTMVTSATGNTTTYTTLSSNNTFGQGQVRYIDIGTFSSTAVTQVSCSLVQSYDPN